ncbi:MAG: hypothetical protein MZU91_11360 [Desulfosudis oleivorans]|nr:hypothetical protein [Desulfosudis oleivorans]
MTTVIRYSCPTCHKELDFGLADLVNGDLIAECGKCRKPIVLERGLRCRDCGRPATERRMNSDITTIVSSPTYFCGEHFAAFRDRRIRRRATFWAYVLPVVSAVFLALGILLKGGNGKPMLILFLIAAFCGILAIVLWRKLRPSGISEDDR